jgi:uncharacterized protein YbjT (DUF2867 family)
MTEKKLILVTGATGYVGGRLVPKLLEAGYRVRCLVRDPSRLEGRAWLKQVEVTAGDALNPDDLKHAMRDVAVAYYLMHGKQGGKDNAERDLQAARNFSHAAEEAKNRTHHLLWRVGRPDRQSFSVSALAARDGLFAAL